MIYLGLDLGTKSLGIAMSDEQGIIAFGVENYNFKPFDYDSAINRVKFYLDKYKIGTIVIGKPLHLSGDESDASRSVDNFVLKLKNITDLPIELIDERFTTKIAYSFLLQGDLSRSKRKQVIDKVASEIILQDYLDGRKK